MLLLPGICQDLQTGFRCTCLPGNVAIDASRRSAAQRSAAQCEASPPPSLASIRGLPVAHSAPASAFFRLGVAVAFGSLHRLWCDVMSAAGFELQPDMGCKYPREQHRKPARPLSTLRSHRAPIGTKPRAPPTAPTPRPPMLPYGEPPAGLVMPSDLRLSHTTAGGSPRSDSEDGRSIPFRTDGGRSGSFYPAERAAEETWHQAVRQA